MTEDNEKEFLKNKNQWYGIKIINRTIDNGILTEIWQEDTINTQQEPTKRWKCIKSWTEKPNDWKESPKDHQ